MQNLTEETEVYHWVRLKRNPIVFDYKLREKFELTANGVK